VEIAYYARREGALMWFDNMRFRLTRLTRRWAHKFLNFHHGPREHGRSIKLCLFANGNKGDQEFLPKKSLGHGEFYPDGATLEKPVYHFFISAKLQRCSSRVCCDQN